MEIALNEIRIDGGTQPRAAINEEAVAEYALKMEDGAIFPPVIVFFDGVDTWLADGFHRFHAAHKAHRKHIEATTKRGTKRDAILYSVGANDSHGLRRTNADKRRAVQTLLNDDEWSAWSDSEIARRCGVHQSFVGDVRRGYRIRSGAAGSKKSSLMPGISEKSEPRSYTTKHGTVATMRTENIGKRPNGVRLDREPHEVRAQQIAELSRTGHTAEQIAVRLGVGEQNIRRVAKNAGVKLVDEMLGKRARLDNRKVIESAVMELDSAAASLRVLPISLDGIPPSDALSWAESIAESIREFRAFERKLRSHHG